MKGKTIAAVATALLSLGAGVPAAGAASLPSVTSGERPGPPALYAPAPQAPQLSLQPPFAAEPLLVSGTDALRGGEYLFQDYLFDDRGADTVPLAGSRETGNPDAAIGATAGDALYPTAERFAANAADIVELRIRPTAEAIVFRVTLNTLKEPDTTVVGLGFDSDRSGGEMVPWPLGAGVSSPGLDRFLTFWGTGGELRDLPGGAAQALPAGAVSADTATNQITVRVPRTLLDPGNATWRLVMGAGLWSGSGWEPVPAAVAPGAETPASGNPLDDAPAVFNLGFRWAEPTTKVPLLPYTTFPGTGNWFEDQQSRALAAGVTDCSFPGAPAGCVPFHADVDFARLAAGEAADLHSPSGREQARISVSSLDVPEGVRDEFPTYGGKLQPYLLTIPPSYQPGRPVPLTFALHSLGGSYTQYKVFSPTQLRQFGDERGSLVVTTLGRGADGWYSDEAEVDFFDVWADVARRFTLDSERVALTGYSMGGYGTYKLGSQYPDLFGKAFTAAGPPGRELWLPPAPVISRDGPSQSTNSNLVLENLRWVPFLNWVEVADELVPYVGPRAQQARFDELGLRSQLWSFGPGEHFTLALLDRWEAARDFLGDARVTRDPGRVDYAFVPAADRPALGLVHDHAYWLSDLRARDLTGDPGTDPARGVVSARSRAFGQGDPPTIPVTSAGATAGPPQLKTVEGTAWGALPAQTPANALELELANVAGATIDGPRARLSGERELRVKLVSDGAGSVRLAVPLPAGVVAERVEGTALGSARRAASAPEVALDRAGATFTVAAGTRAYVIRATARERGRREPDDADREPGDRDRERPAAEAGDGDDGSLPLTGLAVGGLLLAGALGLGAGRALRRLVG